MALVNDTAHAQPAREAARGSILLAVTVLVALFTFWPQLGARLDIRQDDHRIIFAGSDRVLHDQVRSAPGIEGQDTRPSFMASFKSDMLDTGRFRPFTVALEVYLPRVIGTDPLRWHLVWLTMLAVTTGALFIAGRRLFDAPTVAAGFALMVMLAPEPGPARTWFMMAPKAEAIGTLLVALAVILASRAAANPLDSARRRWADAGSLGALLLAGLAKESFVLVLPAVAGLRLLLESRASGVSLSDAASRLKTVVGAQFLMCAGLLGCIAMVLLGSPRDSYGHTFASPWAGLHQTLAHLPSQAVWFIPLLLAGFVLAQAPRHWDARWIRAVLGIAALWVAPQIALYSLRGGMWDHYWLPCTIGISGLNAAALALLRGYGPRLFALAIGCVALWGINGIRVDHTAAANFARRTVALQRALEEVVAHTPKDGKVLLVADGDLFSEYAMSWLFFLGDAGRPHVEVDLYDTRVDHRGRLSRAFFFPRASSLEDRPVCEFDAVLFLNKPAEQDPQWQRWFREGGCHDSRFIGATQRYLSLKTLGWTSGEFGIVVATRSNSR